MDGGADEHQSKQKQKGKMLHIPRILVESIRLHAFVFDVFSVYVFANTF